MMTHDVEGPAGAGSVPVMDLDGQFEIRSSFQVVPDARGPRVFFTRQLVEEVKRRGLLGERPRT